MFAVQEVAVHAAGAEDLPTDSAIDREDDVVLQATLQLRVLHYRFPDLDRLLHRLMEVSIQSLDPLEPWFLLLLLNFQLLQQLLPPERSTSHHYYTQTHAKHPQTTSLNPTQPTPNRQHQPRPFSRHQQSSLPNIFKCANNE